MHRWIKRVVFCGLGSGLLMLKYDLDLLLLPLKGDEKLLWR